MSAQRSAFIVNSLAHAHCALWMDVSWNNATICSIYAFKIGRYDFKITSAQYFRAIFSTVLILFHLYTFFVRKYNSFLKKNFVQNVPRIRDICQNLNKETFLLMLHFVIYYLVNDQPCECMILPFIVASKWVNQSRNFWWISIYIIHRVYILRFSQSLRLKFELLWAMPIGTDRTKKSPLHFNAIFEILINYLKHVRTLPFLLTLSNEMQTK